MDTESDAKFHVHCVPGKAGISVLSKEINVHLTCWIPHCRSTYVVECRPNDYTVCDEMGGAGVLPKARVMWNI